MKKKIIISIGLIIVLILFAFFEWPTLYTKENLNIGMFGTQTIRTNRFTGEKEIYGNKNWQPILISPDGNVNIPKGISIEIH